LTPNFWGGDFIGSQLNGGQECMTGEEVGQAGDGQSAAFSSIKRADRSAHHSRGRDRA